MTNRCKLAVLIAFTAIAGMLNGCDVGDNNGNFRPADYGGIAAQRNTLGVPLCEPGKVPCGSECVSQDAPACAAAMEDPDGFAADLDLTIGAPDYCDDADHWGCPGMPCVHGSCWDGDGWVMDSCTGEIDPASGVPTCASCE